MKTILTLAAVAATMIAPLPAFAQTDTAPRVHHYHGHSRYYYRHCRKSSGTTGLLVGAGGGGLAAAALGAGPVGLAAGVVGGGLLGRHLDKRHDAAQNRRNGC